MSQGTRRRKNNNKENKSDSTTIDNQTNLVVSEGRNYDELGLLVAGLKIEDTEISE